MANINCRPKRTIAGAKWYFTNNLKKRSEHREYVAIEAVNGAMAGTFFEDMEQSHTRFGKDKHVPAYERDAAGKLMRDETGSLVPSQFKSGEQKFEPKHVQYYSLTQGFGLEELDADDPDSWRKAAELGAALAREVSRQGARSHVVKGQIVDKSDAVSSRAAADGHMALVFTEIGSNGKLHNHILIDAVNRHTGRSLNSSFVTHQRLAPTHDRVLAENGFAQRADMLALAAEVQHRQEAGKNGFSYRAVAADILEVATTAPQGVPTTLEARQDLRHEEWLQDVAIARHKGEPLPVEPFSVNELRNRAATALADPRITSWETLRDVAHENHLLAIKRGKSVSFGMMRQQADGSWAEPFASDRRLGSTLGEEFTLASVEEKLYLNSSVQSTMRRSPTLAQYLQPTIAPAVSIAEPVAVATDPSAARAEEPDATPEPRHHRRFERRAVAPTVEKPVAEKPVAGPAAPVIAAPLAMPAEPAIETLPYRSPFHNFRAKPGPNQAMYEASMRQWEAFDEKFAEHFENGGVTNAEFESAARELRLDRKFVDGQLGDSFHPAVRAQMGLRFDALDAHAELRQAARDSDATDYQTNATRARIAQVRIDGGEYGRAKELASHARDTPTESRSMYDEIKDAEARDHEQDGMSL